MEGWRGVLYCYSDLMPLCQLIFSAGSGFALEGIREEDLIMMSENEGALQSHSKW